MVCCDETVCIDQFCAKVSAVITEAVQLTAAVLDFFLPMFMILERERDAVRRLLVLPGLSNSILGWV